MATLMNISGTVLNQVTDIVKGQFGEILTFTMVDDNAVAIDISTYTTRTIIVRSPNAEKSVTWTATFVTDGTNGQLKVTPASGELDIPGTWEGQVTLSKTGVTRYSHIFTMEVERKVA